MRTPKDSTSLEVVHRMVETDDEPVQRYRKQQDCIGASVIPRKPEMLRECATFGIAFEEEQVLHAATAFLRPLPRRAMK